MILAFSTLPFLYNAILSWARGPKAEANPWSARTLEWQTSSPPPTENFHDIPTVTGDPYEYGEPSPLAAEPAAAPASG
jgi:cytochrome c oxidase subunit 1